MRINTKNFKRLFAFVFVFTTLPAFTVSKTNKKSVPLDYLSTSSSAVFQLPLSSSSKEKALSANAGFQVKLDGLDLRFYRSLPKTNLSIIDEAGGISGHLALLDDFRYGGAVFLYRDSMPVKLNFGMNGFSRTVSRLKNPVPSASCNPLKKSFSFSSGIGISLPSLSSSENPISMAFSVEMPFSGLFTLNTQGFMTEERNTGLSSQMSFSFSRSVLFEMSATLARFYIENNSRVLEKNYCSFDPDFFYAAAFETSFKTPFFKTNFYAGLHENTFKKNEYRDFEDFNVWIKTENRLVLKNLLLDFSYFAIPTACVSPKAAPLISGSSSICRTVRQVTLNPQVLIPFADKNASSLRFGVCFTESDKITSAYSPCEYLSGKVRGGILFENRKCSVKCEYGIENILLENNLSSVSSAPDKFHEAKVSFSSRHNLLSVSASGDCKIYFDNDSSESERQTYSFTLGLSPKSKVVSASSSLSVTKKDEKETGGTFSTNCTVKLRSKGRKLRTSFKIGASIPF